MEFNMSDGEDVRRSRGYTTAKFRKDMAEIFASARFGDEIVDVSHHGKPWVSIMSPQSAEYVRQARKLGHVDADDIRELANSLKSPIGLEELVSRLNLAKIRKS
jgi:hypothetical protein